MFLGGNLAKALNEPRPDPLRRSFDVETPPLHTIFVAYLPLIFLLSFVSGDRTCKIYNITDIQVISGYFQPTYFDFPPCAVNCTHSSPLLILKSRRSQSISNSAGCESIMFKKTSSTVSGEILYMSS